MKYSLEKNNNLELIEDINFYENEKYKNIIIFDKHYQELTKTKDHIDNDEIQSNWERVKKIGNPYELIFTMNIDKKNNSICILSPLSRSFFKLIEILNEFNLISDRKIPVNVGCFAEGPGGFIESIFYKRRNKRDKIYGYTLKNSNKNIPGWEKLNEMKKNNELLNICVNNEYRNLYNEEDLKYIFDKHKNSFDLITADGGFDYSVDFNNQEKLSQKMILSEIICALYTQKVGGHFVIKVFDLFSSLTLSLIYLLYIFYDEMHIYKPKTSRPANSEKYIIVKNFKGCSEKQRNNLLKCLLNFNLDENFTGLNFKISNKFIYDMNNFNNLFQKNQIYYLKYTLELAKSDIPKDKLNDIQFDQIRKAIEWCACYNVPINGSSKFIRLLERR